MFADVRGSTAMAEQIGATEFAAVMNRFYGAATGVLVPRHAVVDKMIGDEVMAFYAPALVPNMRATAVDAAVALLHAVGYGSADGPWVEVGIGINFGPAYVGKVGTGDVNDFTALGDTVNTAARMQSDAAAGQIVMSESVHDAVSAEFPDVESIEIDAKGKAELIKARVLTIG